VAQRLMTSVEAAIRQAQESTVLRFVRHLLNDFHGEVFSAITVKEKSISVTRYGKSEE
jgi:hypothetical protein